MSSTFLSQAGGRLTFSSQGVGQIQLLPSIARDLYTFTSFVFSNAGVTGNVGPTYTQVKTAYAPRNAPWTQNQAFLDVQTQGYQIWTVPTTGNYTVEVAGAAGGNSTASNGLGNIVSSTLSFSQNDKVTIVVGQKGGSGTAIGGGGGGGSFVIYSNGQPIICAGGGGGSSPGYPVGGPGINGTSSPAGTFDGAAQGTGGVNGNGGSVVNAGSQGKGGGGTGIFSNGATCGSQPFAPIAYNGQGGLPYATGFLGGAAGGVGFGFQGGIGGFGGGGGGGGSPDSRSCSGGGGGYSGGAGGTVTSATDGGGGGGSYSVSPMTSVGTCSSNGYVRIVKL